MLLFRGAEERVETNSVRRHFVEHAVNNDWPRAFGELALCHAQIFESLAEFSACHVKPSIGLNRGGLTLATRS